VGKAARVGMLFPNSAEFIVAWFAIARIGAVAVPISTLSSAVELGRIIRHADLHLLITVDRFLSHDYVGRLEEALPGVASAGSPYRLAAAPYLRAIWTWGDNVPAWATRVDLTRPANIPRAFLSELETEVSPADQVSIIYSSGSTADPKGVIHSHGAFLHQALKLAASYPYRSDDRLFTPMPFFWVGGLILTLLNGMLKGATILGSGKSGPALLDFLERERVTYVFGWPHLIKALKSDPTFAGRDFSALRGGPLLPAEQQPRNQHFGNALGMTETCGPHTLSPPDYPDHLRGAFGPPMPGMSHKIIDLDTGEALPEGGTGELLVRGDALMQGFVKVEREAVFEPDGWYHTSDLCSFQEGILLFHGRCDDMIKASGANVSPREVEAAILALPGATHAIVMGVADERRGTVVGAVIALEPGAPRDPAMLREVLAKSLSSYKVPRVIITLEPAELPMMSSGKADRRLLAQRLAAAAAQ
jgi:acyl-CoA synthetase (AMP-forming)/AMP-acid ligase II